MHSRIRCNTFCAITLWFSVAGGAGGAGVDALCATLYAGGIGGVGGDALCATLLAGGAEVIRCVLDAVEGGLCLLEVMEVL